MCVCAVFNPSDSDIAAVVEEAFAVNGGQSPPNNGQFNSARFAFLFMPGARPLQVATCTAVDVRSQTPVQRMLSIIYCFTRAVVACVLVCAAV